MSTKVSDLPYELGPGYDGVGSWYRVRRSAPPPTEVQRQARHEATMAMLDRSISGNVAAVERMRAERADAVSRQGWVARMLRRLMGPAA